MKLSHQVDSLPLKRHGPKEQLNIRPARPSKTEGTPLIGMPTPIRIKKLIEVRTILCNETWHVALYLPDPLMTVESMDDRLYLTALL